MISDKENSREKSLAMEHNLTRYEALENMLDKKLEDENKLETWNNRKRIGFKN